MRRAIELVGTDKTLELSKLTVLNIPDNLFHLDELADGTWRLTMTKHLVEDLTQVECLRWIPNSSDLEFVGTDRTLNMAKLIGMKSDVKMVRFDQNPDGSWKMLYDRDTIPDLKKVIEFRFIRED